MEPKLINLDEWIVAGGGAVGENYFHKSDNSIVLKLSNPKISKERSLSEYETSKLAYELGIKCPKVYDFVSYENRFGMTFERILNKKSFAKAMSEDPSKVEFFAEWFAREAKEFHSLKGDSRLPSFVDKFHFLVENTKEFLSEECRNRIMKIIDDTPVENHILHGDFHMGNCIFVDNKFYWIDLGDLCVGNPIFDLGFLYFSSYYGNDDFIKSLYHMERIDIKKFFLHFVKMYYPNMSQEEAVMKIKPYACLAAVLYINFGHRLGPDLADCIKDVVGII
ncbi:MAG: phosphotransferase [Bacilli bacterium]|nr:phosphotransferase [Bacilli bacterium]